VGEKSLRAFFPPVVFDSVYKRMHIFYNKNLRGKDQNNINENG
jgi:hypothetical protein